MTSSYALLHDENYTFAYFFWILSTIKKIGRILVCCLRNTSNMFLAKKTLFISLLKWQQPDLAIFNSLHLPFWNVPLTISKMKHWNLDIIGYWVVIGADWKGPEIYPQFSNLFKRFLKIIVLVYMHQLVKFGGLMSCGSKDIFINAPCLMY